ncbi:MAG TPA: HD domain-containing phosphohydrolase [Usitatibacter sp.]|nr:HD domain-containing phosphohydrolase [Usitatibacter sp.]
MPTETLVPDRSVLEAIRALSARLPKVPRDESAAVISFIVEGLGERVEAEDVPATLDAALTLCRILYGCARSREALVLGKAVLKRATRARERVLTRRAATACGLLSGDTADFVSAIEFHVQALRLAIKDQDPIEVSRVWNNIGTPMGISGNYEMAARCFQRSLSIVEKHADPLYSRYAACVNLADCHYAAGNFAQGLQYAERALLELTPEFLAQDPLSGIILRRNFVRLLVAAGRTAEAEPHVQHALELARATSSPRAQIAADTTRATYEIAIGNYDLALTRLDQALTRAREVPAALHDTLACVIRAEEAAGNAAHALMRLEELSNHVYSTGIARAREHVELESLAETAGRSREIQQEQVKARLVSQLGPREQPEGWEALKRLAVSAAMRMDPSGWHGVRVGALTKALALASGVPPLQALEMGLAAELHDIGMLSVPVGILGKNGPLNDAERYIVQRHPEAGAEMLCDDEHPRVLLAREIVRYHHASWDGNGYPVRVGGEFIPLGARICAIADAYDMMVVGYGGNEPKTMGEALAELRRQAGKQFDPRLVACFDKLIRSESKGRGMRLKSSSGMDDFHALIESLQEDRGFI